MEALSLVKHCLIFTFNMINCFVFLSTAQHLKVKMACTRSADIIYEPQEGSHCIKLNKDSCALAVEHNECTSGQYIKQTGECVYTLNCRLWKTGTKCMQMCFSQCILQLKNSFNDILYLYQYLYRNSIY